MDNLDDFLKGEPEAAAIEPTEAVETTTEAPAEPEAQAEPEGEQPKAERPRGPDGKFIPKGEESASPAPTEAPLDHAALIGERRRRQEAEQRIAEYEARLAQLQQQPVPDQWEDPEGFANHLKSEAVQSAVQAAREEAYQTFQTQRIAMSAEEAKARLPDYGEKMHVFEQMVAQNPTLLQELYRAPNPAEYAYNTAKIQVEISQYGGIDGLINARVQEALKAQVPAAPAPAAPIPETLAGEQSARSSGPATTLSVPSLDDILGRKG